MANKRNNRTAGHNYEREIVYKLNKKTIQDPFISIGELRKVDDSSFHVFPKLACSREVDRAADAKKKDISVVTKSRDNEFPYAIQAKSSVDSISYGKLLEEIKTNNPDKIPLIFHKRTKNTGILFKKQGEYVCMYQEDFIDIMYELARLKFQLKQEEHFDV